MAPSMAIWTLRFRLVGITGVPLLLSTSTRIVSAS